MLEKVLEDRAVVRLTGVARDLEVLSEEPVIEKSALDLFAGTRRVANVLEEKGYTVITLGSDPKYLADIRENILTWTYQQYPPGYFTFISTSPPCTELSPAKTFGERKIREAMAVVNRRLEKI